MGKAEEIVKLCFKKLKNGEKSAYFDIYRNGVREYLWQEERLVPELDDAAKENNQKLILLFEERRRSLIAELTIDKSGIANRAFNTDITLLQLIDLYEIERLQRASRSYMRGYSKLKDYLTGFNADILLKDVNDDFVVSFFEYLKKQPCTNHSERRLTFESCWDLLKKLGNSMNGAIRERIISLYWYPMILLHLWPSVELIIGEIMVSNCSMIENIPPKGVSFSDFICTFAMSYYDLYLF